ncbi:SDR family NAD(P)-dependent oxidoreductase [Pseudonocardia acaciae]|uniref:SDR family NAD(P)-dependent oxidoreductase n=1 Tax=Pseudonocardia acaciae TaxID=551276 RepID=UPI00048D4A29|nr:SDR family oxidoreductase [Pseudonocardia acaciae]
MSSVSGSVAVVTGAGGGIGAAYVAALSAAGASVLAVDLPVAAPAGIAAAERATAAGPGRAVFTEADITDDDDLARMVSTARDRFGGLDALVNNAAVYADLGHKRPLWELDNSDWDRVLTVNVRAVWQAIRAVLPAMRAGGGGRIVNVSSSTARAGTPGFLHYVTSKAAVEGLTRAAAKELGEFGITVNCLAPGLVSDEASYRVSGREYVANAALGRSIKREMAPDDLLGALLWLCSPASSFVTGQTIVVDGGQVLV